MRLSRYNYIQKYKGQYIIFNGLKSTCAILSKKEYADFLHKNSKGDNFHKFLDLGFYCEDNYNEIDEVCFASRLLTDVDKQQFYRIYTTMACNAKCPYCYEKGTAPISMDINTANSVIDFIESRIVNNTKLTIEWFGGEPLVNSKVIDYISEKMVGVCSKKHVEYNSRMVSNGFLFDDSTIQQAKNKWNLKAVQITLDGLKETYERIKGFNSKDSFERVINNIKKLLDNEIRVSIRINYDKKNFDEIKALINYLGQELKSYDGFKVYVRRIMLDKSDNSLKSSEKTDLILLKELLKNNLIKSDILDTVPRRNNTCVAHMLHAYMILPNGNIGKCSQAISKNDIIGKVDDGIDDKKIVKWCTPRLSKKCLNCNLLPLCNGGCIYEKLLKKPFCFASKKIINYKLKYYLKTYIDKNLI